VSAEIGTVGRVRCIPAYGSLLLAASPHNKKI